MFIETKSSVCLVEIVPFVRCLRYEGAGMINDGQTVLGYEDLMMESSVKIPEVIENSDADPL